MLLELSPLGQISTIPWSRCVVGCGGLLRLLAENIPPVGSCRLSSPRLGAALELGRPIEVHEPVGEEVTHVGCGVAVSFGEPPEGAPRAVGGAPRVLLERPTQRELVFTGGHPGFALDLLPAVHVLHLLERDVADLRCQVLVNENDWQALLESIAQPLARNTGPAPERLLEGCCAVGHHLLGRCLLRRRGGGGGCRPVPIELLLEKRSTPGRVVSPKIEIRADRRRRLGLVWLGSWQHRRHRARRLVVSLSLRGAGLLALSSLAPAQPAPALPPPLLLGLTGLMSC